MSRSSITYTDRFFLDLSSFPLPPDGLPVELVILLCSRDGLGPEPFRIHFVAIAFLERASELAKPRPLKHLTKLPEKSHSQVSASFLFHFSLWLLVIRRLTGFLKRPPSLAVCCSSAYFGT